MDSNSTTAEQLVELINNSSNNSNSSRLDYYNKNLASCSTDIAFRIMLNSITFKEIVPLPQNPSMFRFVVKCYNNSNNVIIGPVKESSVLLDKSEMTNLSIPMSHYHLTKNNYVQDNFVHKVSSKETLYSNKFIERIRLIDSHIKSLITNYIKRVDMTSPIANLLIKNHVTYNQNWIYTGIINKKDDVEYINLRYFRNSINGKSKLGTNVYYGDSYSNEIADLLSRDTYCYIYGNIYPIIKVCYVLVNERVVNNVPMVNFTCKAYFLDINFSPNSVRCNTNRIQKNKLQII